MRKTLLALVVVGATLGLAAPGFAQMMGGMMQGGMQGGGGGMGPGTMGGMGEAMPGGRGMRHPHEGPQITLMLHHARDLGLTPDQERSLRDLRTAFEKEFVRKRAEIRVAEIDLDALLAQERWDMAKVEALAKQIATLQADLRVARLKTIAQGRALLTPDQLQKLKDLAHRMGPPAGGGPMRQGMGMPDAAPRGVPGTAPGNPPGATHQH